MTIQNNQEIASNRRARFDYEILETIEAGIVLQGTEVKSLRAGRVSMAESFAMIRNQEIYLLGLTIPQYEMGNRFNHEPDRDRKLLLHKREILRLQLKIKQDGLALVPLKLYFKNRKVKVLLGLGKGKKLYDKRESKKDQDLAREIQQAKFG